MERNSVFCGSFSVLPDYLILNIISDISIKTIYSVCKCFKKFIDEFLRSKVNIPSIMKYTKYSINECCNITNIRSFHGVPIKRISPAHFYFLYHDMKIHYLVSLSCTEKSDKKISIEVRNDKYKNIYNKTIYMEIKSDTFPDVKCMHVVIIIRNTPASLEKYSDYAISIFPKIFDLYNI
jgi:hypothetical protein